MSKTTVLIKDLTACNTQTQAQEVLGINSKTCCFPPVSFDGGPSNRDAEDLLDGEVAGSSYDEDAYLDFGDANGA